MLKLRAQSSQAWLDCVLANFDTFMQDHASCEKKAHTSALALISHYPDKVELIDEMIELAVEELNHYQQVWQRLKARGTDLGTDQKDPYIRQLLKHVRNGREGYFLDRLLVFGIVEARGCERFGMVADALEPGPLKTFYDDITRSEARHHGLFVRLARTYFDEETVAQRLDELLNAEAEIVCGLEIRPALH